jgi:hypothetical protein
MQLRETWNIMVVRKYLSQITRKDSQVVVRVLPDLQVNANSSRHLGLDFKVPLKEAWLEIKSQNCELEA